MKKLFIGSVALVALGLVAPAAFAADRAVPAYAPPPPPVPVYTWSGCYVGASAGTSYGRSDGFSTTPASRSLNAPGGIFVQPVSSAFDLSGFIGGFHGGCNYQVGMWVVGFEGDWSATNKEGQGALIALGPQGPSVPGATAVGFGIQDSWHLQERWLATARGRIGLAGWWGDRSLVYVTGGAAWAKIDSAETVTGALGGACAPSVIGALVCNTVLQSETRTGWTIGGGLEYALGYGWSARGEYLYVDFGDWTTFTTPQSVTYVSNLNTNLKDHIFRAGISYKFW